MAATGSEIIIDYDLILKFDKWLKERNESLLEQYRDTGDKTYLAQSRAFSEVKTQLWSCGALKYNK